MHKQNKEENKNVKRLSSAKTQPIPFWKRTNYGHNGNIGDCQQWWVGGISGWSTGDFQNREIALADTVMIETQHSTFVQAHRMHNTKSEPQHKLWTLGDDDIQCRFITYNITNVPLWQRALIVGSPQFLTRVYGNSPYFLLDCAVNLKLF